MPTRPSPQPAPDIKNSSERYAQKPSGRNSVYFAVWEITQQMPSTLFEWLFPMMDRKLKGDSETPDKSYAAQDCTGSHTCTVPLPTENLNHYILPRPAPDLLARLRKLFSWLCHYTCLPDSCQLFPRRVIRSGCLRRGSLSLSLITFRPTHANP